MICSSTSGTDERARRAASGRLGLAGCAEGQRARHVADVLRRQADTLGTGTPKSVSMKAQGRGVVEHLGGHEAALGEGRHEEARHAEAEADRAAMPPASAGSGLTVRYSPGVPGRRHGRRHVVEEAAVLVVVEDEQRVGPHLGVRGQGVEDGLDQVLAPLRRRGGVLALGDGAVDPADLGQGAGGDVGDEVGRVVRREAPAAAAAGPRVVVGSL